MRARARERLPQMVFDLIDGAADDERTLRANERAFEQAVFRPRVGNDVGTLHTGIELFGTPLAFPVVLGPTGLPGLAHPRAELDAARAAAAAGTIFSLSTFSSYGLARVASETPGPLWFQLYTLHDRELTGVLIDQVKAAGYRALLVTLDTAVPGNRERDVRNGLALPPRATPANIADLARHPRWIIEQLRGPGAAVPNIRALAPPTSGGFGPAGYLMAAINPRLTWEDVAWIKRRFGGPVLAKGVITPEDALRALDAGCDGIVISNHGGRQLDRSPATLSVLPEIAAAVDGRMAVLIDGGIRRGGDVAIALALGATACLVARPWLWGLAAGGYAGVLRVLAILRAEFERTLALVGEPDARRLRPELVRLRD